MQRNFVTNILYFCDKTDLIMRDKIQEQIRRRIIRQGHKKVYINADFADIASPDAIRKALQRLCDCGFIVREQRGVYSYPVSTRLGPLRPSSLDLAKAIARRDSVQIAHTSARAENLLGLSTQVPMKVVFLTNGSGRTIQIFGGGTIRFVHTSDHKIFAYKLFLMQDIVLSMREFGADELTDEELGIISMHLTHVSEKDFLHDISLAPQWIQKILRQLYKKSTNNEELS